jgi:hypothetical protein
MGKSEMRGKEGDFGRNVNASKLYHPVHDADQVLVEGRTVRVKRVRCIQFRTTVERERILSLQGQTISPGQFPGQVLLAILNSLINVFRRADTPS